jgi:hypothetical protein
VNAGRHPSVHVLFSSARMKAEARVTQPSFRLRRSSRGPRFPRERFLARAPALAPRPISTRRTPRESRSPWPIGMAPLVWREFLVVPDGRAAEKAPHAAHVNQAAPANLPFPSGDGAGRESSRPKRASMSAVIRTRFTGRTGRRVKADLPQLGVSLLALSGCCCVILVYS